MAVTLAALFLNAFFRTLRVEGRRSRAQLELAKTLSLSEWIAQAGAFQETLRGTPKTSWEYFANVARYNSLNDSELKAMKHLAVDGKLLEEDSEVEKAKLLFNLLRYDFDGPNSYVTRSTRRHFLVGTPEWEAASKDYTAKGNDPLHRPHVTVPGDGTLSRWWILFYVAGMILIIPYNCIELRRRKMKIFAEVAGNPVFPLSILFWPSSLFLYPKDETPAEQLVRARRWATLVLSSSISCFAGTGKICEKKETAPQYQPYDRILDHFAFSSLTLSDYVGDDGGVFHPATVQQSSVAASLPCGIYLKWWNSIPLGDRDLSPNHGRENDYSAGWTFPAHRFLLDANAAYIDVSPQTQWLRGDVFQAQLLMARTFKLTSGAMLQPYILLRGDAAVRGSKPIG